MNTQQLFQALSVFILILLLAASCDTSTSPDDDNDQQEFSHTLNPGASNEDFLRNDRFTELLVEIQYMGDYRPTDSALNELQSFLEEHLDKSVTILEPEEIPSGDRSSYSANAIRDLEAEHRRNFSEGNTLVSYNLFVDGEFDQQQVLGIAYYNTSNAYFGETIHSVSGSPPLNPPRDKIEATVMRHEYGHLFGLVKNGTEMQVDHQENGFHCNDDECVMYATVNTADFFQNLFDDTIPNFDQLCRADIEAVQEEDDENN